MNTSRGTSSATTLVLLTCLLFALGPVTVDLSLPVLPAIQHAIGTASQRVELTLTAVLLGMAVGQFLVGAVADAYGRKQFLIVSLAVYSAAAAACALSTSLNGLAIARFAQALGLGVAVVISRSVVADAFEGRAVARVYSTAVMATGVMTVIAPLVGGQLLALQGWRAVFLLMAILGGLSVLFILLAVPETLPPERRSRAEFTHVLGAYFTLLRNPAFSSSALIASCAAAAQFTYNTGAPAMFIERYGLTPATCGIYMAVIALSIAVCSQASGWLLRWFTPVQILSGAVPAALLAGLLTLGAATTGMGGVPGIAGALLLGMATVGFIMPNAMAVAMMSAGPHAGAASALMGVLMFAIGTIGSAVVGASHDPSGRFMAAVISTLAFIGLLQLWRVRRLPAGG